MLENTRLVNELEAQTKTLREINQALVQANKIKNRFITSVSHELRTPLNSVIGYSEILQEQLDGPLRYTLAAYYTSFGDFIFKDFTGIECGEEFNTCGVEDELMQIAYTQEDATFLGFEASADLDVHRFENGAILSLTGVSKRMARCAR